MAVTYETKLKELTKDSGMGVYGMAELIGRDADQRIRELESALKPFAQFSCSPRGACDCRNCRARDLTQ